MDKNISLYVKDFGKCIIWALKILIIPVLLGIFIGVVYNLVKHNPMTLKSILDWVKSIGMIFSCFGLFISAAGYLRPAKGLAPLNYQKEWREHFSKFNLVGAITAICAILLFIFLMYDVVLWYIY